MNIRPYSRSERFGHELKKILGEILLKEVDTSEIGFITITRVKVSKDLKYARVYISVLKRDISKRKIEYFFSRRAKHIRMILGSRIKSKSVPELRFYYDDTYEEIEKLDRLFDEIHQTRPVSK